MTSEAPAISVPCASCSAPICFGDLACPACRAPVPRASEAALEARLEASSEDFRELKANVRRASSILLVLAGFHLVAGALIYLLSTSPDIGAPDASAALAARLDLAADVIIGAAMIGCFAWSRRAPVRALTAASLVWLAVQVAPLLMGGVGEALLAIGLSSWRGLAKVATLFLLVRGTVSAWKAGQIRAALVRRSG